MTVVDIRSAGGFAFSDTLTSLPSAGNSSKCEGVARRIGSAGNGFVCAEEAATVVTCVSALVLPAVHRVPESSDDKAGVVDPTLILLSREC